MQYRGSIVSERLRSWDSDACGAAELGELPNNTQCRQFLVRKVVPVEKSNKKAGKYVINAYPCAIEIVWLMTVLAKTSRAAKAADNRPNKR